jgi:Domain of unknown function (DUF3395)
VQNYSAQREEDSVNANSERHFLICVLCALVAVSAVSATAQNNWNGYNPPNPYQGKLRAEDQKRFDDYYAKWVHDRERQDKSEIASMEDRMLDVYVHNGIPSNVPYDLVASPDVALPMTGFQHWQGRVRPDDQKRFDSYFTRWMEYRAKRDKEQIASMQGRMLDVYAHNNIPMTTPYEFIASPNVVPNVGFNYMGPQNMGQQNNGGYGNGSLRILQASYGSAGRQADVSGRLQGMISNQGLRLRVNNDSMGGDPAPNTHKQLSVVYSYHGQQRNVTVDEGQDLQIP